MSELTRERLKYLLRYDSEKGVFYNKAPRHGCPRGGVAGRVRRDGYVQLQLDGTKYLAHRLVWFYVYGRWPVEQIDHIDRDRANNRISNLREATGSENRCNTGCRQRSASGLKGVRKKPAGTFEAYIVKHGCWNYLGTFKTAKLAHAAYSEAAERMHGEFGATV